MIIRNEKPEDYRVVEEMIKKTFWNLSVPGCNEHYFAHQVRKSADYIPELDFVMEENGQIIGHILYVSNRWKRNIAIRRNCFISIQERMFYGKVIYIF